MIDVSKAIPCGVICLLSALEYYKLTKFQSSEIYVAIPRKKWWEINIDYPPVALYYYDDDIFNSGIDDIEIPYGTIRIYCKEITVCDAFKY